MEIIAYLGFVFGPAWIACLATVVLFGFFPVALATVTRSVWVHSSTRQLVYTSGSVESPATWLSVFQAVLIWITCSSGFFLILIVFGNKVFSGFAFDILLIYAAMVVLLANALVKLLISDSSSENWLAGSTAIGLFVLLCLLYVGLPRLVYEPLGLGYIRCKSGSVLVDKIGADKIARKLSDAIDSKQPVPMAIQKYDVEIVSRIGRESLLELGIPGKDGVKKRVFVPTESIIDYERSMPVGVGG